MPTSPDFDKWLAGLGAVEEDHVFMPIGAQSQELTALYMERAHLLTAASGEEDVPDADKAIGESFSQTLADIDRRIADQLEKDAPNAPRFRLRGLSDDDYTEVKKHVAKMAEDDDTMTNEDVVVEANVRYVARAVVQPEGVTPDDIRTLRKSLNRGEWARLLAHVNALANADAEATDLPN